MPEDFIFSLLIYSLTAQISSLTIMQAVSINSTNFRHEMNKKNKYTKYKLKLLLFRVVTVAVL